MRFILAEALDETTREDERSYRKNVVIQALIAKLKVKIRTNPTFFSDIFGFLFAQRDAKNLLIDEEAINSSFGTDSVNLAGRMSLNLSSLMTRMLDGKGSRYEFLLPDISRTKQLVISDAMFGDGAVSRVQNTEGKYDVWMLIPDGGNPEAEDLVEGYWLSVRNIIKKTLPQGP